MNWSFPYCPEPGAPLDWEALNQAFSWVRDLKGVEQEPRWHAEGDVWIHTKMVLEELLQLPDYQSLPRQQQQILFTATLLHDVAKPMTTRVEDGVIRSPGHAVLGEKISRQILWKGQPSVGLAPAPFVIREQICALVRYHGLPLNFKFDDFTAKRMRKVSHQTSLSLLATLAKADVMGRICEDQDKALLQPAYFLEYADELGCRNQPFPFKSDLSRYDYFRKEDGNAFYEAFDDRKFNAIIMCGLPGSGKDTWIKQNYPSWPIVSMDAIRREMGISPTDNQGKVIQEAYEQARVHMRARENFVWNSTNVIRDRRSKILQLVAEYKGKPEVVYIEPARELLFQQNSQRQGVEKVPVKVIERMEKGLDMPGVWEAAKVRYIIEGVELTATQPA